MMQTPKPLGPRMISTVALIFICAFVNRLPAQDFSNSIVSTDFDFITEEDPSTFEKLDFTKRGTSEMPDKRDDGELWQDAFEFVASFNDGTSVAIFVHASGKDRKSARDEAMRFVHPLGKLPTALRQGVRRLCVHPGGKTTTAFSDVGLIVVYADNATVRIKNHDLEETIFHESVHASWDEKHASSDRWKRAQMMDGQFVTLYAKSKPKQEDLAETALFAYTIVHHPKRLPQAVVAKLKRTIGYRIMFVEELIPANKPIHCKVSKRSFSPSQGTLQMQLPGVAADIIGNCLIKDFQIDEKQIKKLTAGAHDRYETSEALFQAVVKRLDVDPEKLRQSILANLYVNSDVSDKGNQRRDDSALRDFIKSWKSAKSKD